MGADDNGRFAELLAGMGLPVTSESFQWTADSHIVGWELVKRGLGIGGMVREVGDVTPGLVRILPQLATFPVPYWVCTHRELNTSRRIRVVFDRLVEALAVRLAAA